MRNPFNTIARADILPLTIVLPVMRLYKPKLFTQGASSGSLMPTTLSEATALQHEFAMSSMLILPDSFGCAPLYSIFAYKR